jgi:hypothetical protein
MKITILPKALYRFKGIPVKPPISFFTETGRCFLTFMYDHKRLQIAKMVLRKNKKQKHNSREIASPDLKIHYRARAIKKKYHTSTKTDRNKTKQNKKPQTQTGVNVTSAVNI